MTSKIDVSERVLVAKGARNAPVDVEGSDADPARVDS